MATRQLTPAEKTARFLNSGSRLKRVPLATITKTGTAAATFQQILPKTGLLHKLRLIIRGTVTGTPTGPNTIGKASIISRVRVSSNSSNDIFNCSGLGYFYGLVEGLESEYFNIATQNDARTAVAAGAFTLDMVIPISVNMRDPVGLILLQNEQTQLTLTIEFAAASVVATSGITDISCTVEPIMEFFTVPADVNDLPDMSRIHQIVEDFQPVGAAGEVTYTPQRGNIYLQLFHLFNVGVSGTDQFNRFRVRVNQSDFWDDLSVNALENVSRELRGRARVPGTIIKDYMAESGLGNYGLARDFFNSARVVDYAHLINVTSAGALTNIRRQLVPLR